MRSRSRYIHPATLFILLTVGIVLISWLLDIYGATVFNAQSNDYLRVQSLLNPEGARWLLRHGLSNLTEFSPLTMSIVALLGIGIAEDSGYIESLSHQLNHWRFSANAFLVIMIVLGLLSNAVGDAGYVVLIPLMAAIAPYLGLHPLTAIIVTFVSVACGYSANVVLSSMDPLLARITEEVSINNGIAITRSGSYINYYFMFASSFVLAGLIFVLSKFYLIPKLERANYKPAPIVAKTLSHREKRSLSLASFAGLFFFALILWLTFSSVGLFRGVSGELVRSPFIIGALLVLSITLGIMGFVYGLSSGRYRNDSDVVEGLTSAIRQLSLFFVIVFFAAQFFACLSYTRLDQFIILYGGQFIAQYSFGVLGTLLLFILYVTTVNLVMVSAVGKWTLIAPLFIPLFSSLGVAPDVLQAAYRIGDSATNGITPFLYYIPFVLAVITKYQEKVSFGFLYSYSWVFALTILIVWCLLFFAWLLLGLPFGV